MDAQLIISGCDRHPDKGIRTYYQYLEFLFQNRDPPDSVEMFAKGYEDYLQCPLQVGVTHSYTVPFCLRQKNLHLGETWKCHIPEGH